VTAFYGQNGDGKTRILNSFRHALQGYSTGLTQLICEFEPGSSGYEWALKEVAAAARDSRYEATPDHVRKWLRDAIENWFAQAAGGGEVAQSKSPGWTSKLM
jgi:hypothetical protein